MIPRVLEGQEVIIVAGGPSLRQFRWDLILDRRVIAINRAYEVCPNASVLWWSDARFWRDHREALLAHGAPWKATLDWHYGPDELPADRVTMYRTSGLTGFDERRDYLRHGNNSTYAAIHLAVHLGAARIILLGLDMNLGPAGETHWHAGHRINPTAVTLTEKMAPYFDTLVPALAIRGIVVLNANPHSGINTWSRVSIGEALGLSEGAERAGDDPARD